jgi:hypothetical protein
VRQDPAGPAACGRAGRRVRRRGVAGGAGLACLAADAGDWHQAAVLQGAAHAVLDRIGLPWEEPEAHYRRDSLDQVRTHLGPERFERAYATGMALSSDETLDLASGKALPA